MTATETAAVITAGRTRIERHIIRREPAEAAAAQVIVEADIGPHAAVSRNGDTLAVAGTRRDDTSFLSVIDLTSGKHTFSEIFRSPQRDCSSARPPDICGLDERVERPNHIHILRRDRMDGHAAHRYRR